MEFSIEMEEYCNDISSTDNKGGKRKTFFYKNTCYVLHYKQAYDANGYRDKDRCKVCKSDNVKHQRFKILMQFQDLDSFGIDGQLAAVPNHHLMNTLCTNFSVPQEDKEAITAMDRVGNYETTWYWVW